jgi:hypothetical protein
VPYTYGLVYLSVPTPTVPKAGQKSELYFGVYLGASPLAGKFPKMIKPTSPEFHFAHLPLEISRKIREGTQLVLLGLDPLAHQSEISAIFSIGGVFHLFLRE